jgi:4-hydroxybenzoate polyprenyltransferase
MKRIADFFIYANIFIALCAAVFTAQTFFVFFGDEDPALDLILINFIATFILYNLQRLYFSAGDLVHAKYAWHTRNRRLLFTLVFLLIALSFNFVWNFFALHSRVLAAYALLSVFSLLYFLPPFRLRKYGCLKPFFISLVYVFVGVLIPCKFRHGGPYVLYALGQFTFIAALCILFDIRDYAHDKALKMSSFPVKFGERKTKMLALALLLVYLFCSVLVQHRALMISSIITFILSAVLTVLANERRHNYYYAYLVDGTIIVQGLLLLFV